MCTYATDKRNVHIIFFIFVLYTLYFWYLPKTAIVGLYDFYLNTFHKSVVKHLMISYYTTRRPYILQNMQNLFLIFIAIFMYIITAADEIAKHILTRIGIAMGIRDGMGQVGELPPPLWYGFHCKCCRP